MALSLAPRLYFENPVGRLLEHPDDYLIVEYGAGIRKLTHLQAFLRHATNFVQLRGITKMISDQRRMSPFTEAETTWIVEYWLDVFEKQGVELQGAVLLPHDVFARLSVGNLMNEAKTAAMTYRMFDNEQEAVLWLQQS